MAIVATLKNNDSQYLAEREYECYTVSMLTLFRNLKCRGLVFFVAVAAWALAFLCVLPEPSHACCQGVQPHRAAMAMPCCTASSTTVTATPSLNIPSGEWSAVPVMPPPVLPQSAFVSGDSQALLAQQYIPDQSGRYLELRVLLN
jgi:hypothetical protein